MRVLPRSARAVLLRGLRPLRSESCRGRRTPRSCRRRSTLWWWWSVHSTGDARRKRRADSWLGLSAASMSASAALATYCAYRSASRNQLADSSQEGVGFVHAPVGSSSCRGSCGPSWVARPCERTPRLTTRPPRVGAHFVRNDSARPVEKGEERRGMFSPARRWVGLAIIGRNHRPCDRTHSACWCSVS